MGFDFWVSGSVKATNPKWNETEWSACVRRTSCRRAYILFIYSSYLTPATLTFHRWFSIGIRFAGAFVFLLSPLLSLLTFWLEGARPGVESYDQRPTTRFKILNQRPVIPTLFSVLFLCCFWFCTLYYFATGRVIIVADCRTRARRVHKILFY